MPRKISSYKEKLLKLAGLADGFLTYRRIRRKFKGASVLVYDYSGIGDVYVFCLYVKANYHAIENGNFVITIVNDAQRAVFEIFGLSNYYPLNERGAKNLTILLMSASRGIKGRNITPFPRFNHADLSFRFGGRFLTMAEMYKYQFFKLPREAPIQYPVFKADKTRVDRLFLEGKLIEGKTAVISPYAKTLENYSGAFWETLARKLKDRGFTVCTNVAGKETPVRGTVPVSFALADGEEVLKRAGLFIALRSGLCDVLCRAGCEKIILYPDYRMFNSSMYDFCSFEKMGIGRSITEIVEPLDNEDRLLERILEAAGEKH
ncbi:MAG: hypothetical protein LBG84_11435 [Treponema sp.]|jgi:hypothetical protein|nr:hypothetical protein [Treponema sp.]